MDYFKGSSVSETPEDLSSIESWVPPRTFKTQSLGEDTFLKNFEKPQHDLIYISCKSSVVEVWLFSYICRI